MPADDMLDVLHYFFEDDLNMSTAEQAEARDKTRTAIYEELYGRRYAHATGTSAGGKQRQSQNFKDFDIEEPQQENVHSFNPAEKPKPYIPPTRFDERSARPYGSVLDAPLG